MRKSWHKIEQDKIIDCFEEGHGLATLLMLECLFWKNDLKSAEIETVNQKEIKQPDFVFVCGVP